MYIACIKYTQYVECDIMGDHNTENTRNHQIKIIPPYKRMFLTIFRAAKRRINRR